MSGVPRAEMETQLERLSGESSDSDPRRKEAGSLWEPQPGTQAAPGTAVQLPLPLQAQ